MALKQLLTVLNFKSETSERFDITVKFRQGDSISTLLFNTVIEQVTSDSRVNREELTLSKTLR